MTILRSRFRMLVVFSTLVVVAGCGSGSNASPQTSSGAASTLAASIAAQVTAAPGTATSTSSGQPATSASATASAVASLSSSASGSTGASAVPSGSAGSSLPATTGTTGSGAPGASSAPMKGGFSGKLFAFGVTYEQADEIGKTRIDYFKQLNPNVDLKVSESDFAPDTFLTAMQDANNPPDVVRLDTNLIGTYVAKGILAPLDQCFSTMGVDAKSIFYPSVLAQATMNGQIYGAPEFLTTQNWFINQSAFTDAGLDANSFDFSNWDTIKSANQQLLKMNGNKVSAIGIDPKLPEFLPLWAKANGADLISADGKTAQLNDPKVVEALQFAVDLVNAHGGRDPFFNFRQNWDFFGADNEFAKDQVGAFPMEQWYLSTLAGVSPNIDLLVKPFVDRQGKGVTYAEGSSLAITAASKNPDAACAFVATLTNQEAWIKAAQARVQIRSTANPPKPNTGVFSANQVANQMMFSQINPPDQMPAPFGDAVKVVLDNSANAFAIPASGGNATIFSGDNSIVSQAVARALNGENIQQVLDDANTQAQQAIDDAGSSQ